MNMRAFVAAPPRVAVAESNRARLVETPHLQHEGGNARLRQIGSAWRLPGGSIDLRVP